MAQTWQAWIRGCSRDPNSPAKLPKGCLGMLTGQDTRALAAVSACWALYSNSDDDGQRAALAAIRPLLKGMQAKCRFLAKELIPFHMNWEDRDRLWPLVSEAKDAAGNHCAHPGCKNRDLHDDFCAEHCECN